jgi:hypothetical protein
MGIRTSSSSQRHPPDVDYYVLIRAIKMHLFHGEQQTNMPGIDLIDERLGGEDEVVGRFWL